MSKQAKLCSIRDEFIPSNTQSYVTPGRKNARYAADRSTAPQCIQSFSLLLKHQQPEYLIVSVLPAPNQSTVISGRHLIL